MSQLFREVRDHHVVSDESELLPQVARDRRPVVLPELLQDQRLTGRFLGSDSWMFMGF